MSIRHDINPLSHAQANWVPSAEKDETLGFESG